MDGKLTDLALYRAGWGDNSIALDDALTTEPADDLNALPRLIRAKCTPAMANFLSWTDRSGCALQCLYQIEPVGRLGPTRLMAAEAVRRASRADSCEIELVDGWRGEPYFWGNRSLHEEEMEAAVHGMPPGTDLQLMSDPGYFGEVEQRFRGSGTRIPAKWNARRSVATLVGQFPPVGVETVIDHPTVIWCQ